MAKLLHISFISVIKMTHKTKNERRVTSGERRFKGSAIILAVVLTTLLAIIGVLFLFSSRVDSVATSAVGDNHDLKLAVDTVVAQISEVLTNNVPRVDANGIYYGTYYNYPDGNNSWLACLEPYQSGSNYFWQQASNIYGSSVFQTVQALPLPEYQPVVTPYNTLADADGDGVSDSIWVQISDVNSSKGKPIYAAIRIIDNGGMLNINTGYWFDANADPNYTNGSSQTQINLLAFANRPFYTLTQADMQARADYLNNYRCGSGPNDITDYANNVVWQYGLPNGAYTPFDISDELELRYRYLLNQTSIDTRSEAMKNWEIGRKYDFQTPISSASDLNEWFRSSNSDYVLTDPNYEYRHIATTYNMDRIIAPDGSKMVNVNFTDIISLRNRIQQVLDPNVYDVNQIAVNLIDYIDTDSNVTYFQDPNTGHNYYGFEQPCIYISQIAENFYQTKDAHGAITATYHSYAIELFKPYAGDPLPDTNNQWQLVISSNPNPIPILWPANSSFLVIANIDPTNNAPLDINNVDAVVDNNVPGIVFGAGDNISLQREVIVNGSPSFITVDSLNVPAPDSSTGWLIDSNSSSPHSIKRDITLNKCIRRLWESLSAGLQPPDLGSFSGRYVSPDTYMIQAHPANKPFTNIGEIGQLFRIDANMIGPGDTEASVRLNIADPCVQNLFEYLTVMDPAPGDPNQTRIKGRININTAPWYVLAQLPWVSYQNYNLAQAIVNYRDTYGAFKSTGELMQVIDASNDFNSMSYYQSGATIPPGLLTPPDGTNDAFELRDTIFARISNLVTVRSDVFTAYILVRIGQNGPQKRVIAIFDRSGVPAKKVKIVAIQQVPDPR
jgi:Helix-hairpin-helix motif